MLPQMKSHLGCMQQPLAFPPFKLSLVDFLGAAISIETTISTQQEIICVRCIFTHWKQIVVPG